jgi:hypothetical protein
VYALTPVKAQAVALETQRVWCSLAERLGMFAIKVRWQPARLYNASQQQSMQQPSLHYNLTTMHFRSTLKLQLTRMYQ